MCTLGLLRRGPACCLVPTLFSVCARAAEASDESRTDCNVLSGVGRDALQQQQALLASHQWYTCHPQECGDKKG